MAPGLSTRPPPPFHHFFDPIAQGVLWGVPWLTSGALLAPFPLLFGLFSRSWLTFGALVALFGTLLASMFVSFGD